jgi:hypothetical protein
VYEVMKLESIATFEAHLVQIRESSGALQGMWH